jgi:formate dehydrogenase gamma subunit
MIFLLALFFVLQRPDQDRTWQGRLHHSALSGIERFAHWLMAGSFIVLAISGLNMLFGRFVLMPVIGKEAFAAVTLWGKYLHNYLSFAFMAGVALAFVLWVAHNLPSRHDLVWIMKGGGILFKGSHPPAKKFNFGQKVIFWSVTLLTISVSLSGIALMFPYETAFMAKTFAFLNNFGFDLPTALSPIQEQQLNQVWHTIVGVTFIVIILAHIYIGSVGMEGAFDAMGSGEVDANWAREHHSLWVEEMEQKGSWPGASACRMMARRRGNALKAPVHGHTTNSPCQPVQLEHSLPPASAKRRKRAAGCRAALPCCALGAIAWAAQANDTVAHRRSCRSWRPGQGGAVSPSGSTALSGSFDYSMMQWDVTDPARPGLVNRFTDHDGAVNAVAFLPGGKLALSGSDDGIVRYGICKRQAPARLRGSQPQGCRPCRVGGRKAGGICLVGSHGQGLRPCRPQAAA